MEHAAAVSSALDALLLALDSSGGDLATRQLPQAAYAFSEAVDDSTDGPHAAVAAAHLRALGMPRCADSPCLADWWARCHPLL